MSSKAQNVSFLLKLTEVHAKCNSSLCPQVTVIAVQKSLQTLKEIFQWNWRRSSKLSVHFVKILHTLLMTLHGSLEMLLFQRNLTQS